MHKRIAAAVLWFFACWTAGSFLTYMVGMSPLFGPILGVAAAALFAGDPRRIIWIRDTAATAAKPQTAAPDPA